MVELPGMCRRCGPETRFDFRFATADHDQLSSLGSQFVQARENQIHAFLRCQSTDHGEQGCFPPDRKAHFSLQFELANLFATQLVGAVALG